MSGSHDPTSDETAPSDAPLESQPAGTPPASPASTAGSPDEAPVGETPSEATPPATASSDWTEPLEDVGSVDATGDEPPGETALTPEPGTASEAVADARDAADAAAAEAAEAAEAAADARDSAETAAAAAAAVAGVDQDAAESAGAAPSDDSTLTGEPPSEADPVFEAAAAAADAAATATAAAAAAEAAATRLTEVADRDPTEAAAVAAEALAAAAEAKEAAALAAAAAEAATRAAAAHRAVADGAIVTDPSADAVAAGTAQPGDVAATAATVAVVDGAAGGAATPRRAPLRRAVGAFLGTIAALIIGLATGILIVAVAVAVLFNPIWVGIGQAHAESGLKTGYGPDDLRTATDSILADLVLGPPDFDVQVLGQPVLSEAERGHMRDVRTVFVGFAGVTLIAVVVMIVARLATRGSVRFWKRVRRGARVTAVVTVALGLTGLVAFDTMFQLFHELLFPGGNFNFDPNTDRLVQLFPEQFWLETTLVLGGVIVGLSYLVVRWAGRHVPKPAKSAAVASGRTVAPGRPAG